MRAGFLVPPSQLEVREGRARKVAIRCGESVRSHGDLAAEVNRVGSGLLSLGLKEKQRVLLLLPNCPEFAVAILV